MKMERWQSEVNGRIVHRNQMSFIIIFGEAEMNTVSLLAEISDTITLQAIHFRWIIITDARKTQ